MLDIITTHNLIIDGAHVKDCQFYRGKRDSETPRLALVYQPGLSLCWV